MACPIESLLMAAHTPVVSFWIRKWELDPISLKEREMMQANRTKGSQWTFFIPGV
jgi:hypothetical protein